MEDTTAENDRSNGDDDQSMQPPSAMLSLLDKYSRMDAQMTHVRQEITRIQLEIQRRNANAAKQMEERQEMIVEQERISKETQILQQDAKKARQKLKSIQQETLQASQRKEEARLNLSRLELQAKEYRQRFFQASQSFRKECKKRKLTCQTLRLTHAPLVAHAMVFQPRLLSSFVDKNDQDKTGRSQEEEDHSNRLIQQLKALEASHADAKQRRDRLLQQKDNLVTRAKDRGQRKLSLQAQLGRITKDIDTLNSRLQQSKNDQPTERNANSSCPVQTTTARNNTTTVGGTSNVVYNPYAKSNRKKPSQSLSRKRATNDPQQAPVSTNSWSGVAATTEQYPHRVGRRRANREFGLSLRLEDGTDDDSSEDGDDDALLSFVAFRK